MTDPLRSQAYAKVGEYVHVPASQVRSEPTWAVPSTTGTAVFSGTATARTVAEVAVPEPSEFFAVTLQEIWRPRSDEVRTYVLLVALPIDEPSRSHWYV